VPKNKFQRDLLADAFFAVLRMTTIRNSGGFESQLSSAHGRHFPLAESGKNITEVGSHQSQQARALL
jgi:hypothetical protein